LWSEQKGSYVAERKASDLFVECLEAEGVEYVFGLQALDEQVSGVAFVRRHRPKLRNSVCRGVS